MSFEHGEIKSVDVGLVRPNNYNPNYLTSSEFGLLKDNIEKVGFLDPILVVPKLDKKGKLDFYEICDGEHRFEAMRSMGFKDIPVIIADPEKFTETTQKLQTVRMNKIRGQLNTKKFNALVDNLIDSGEVSIEDAAYNFGFADEDEFDLIRETMRESLPNAKAKKEFDKKSKEAKSADEIYLLVMSLIKKYSSTLPANWMIIAIGRGRNLWCMLDGRHMRDFEAKARECLEEGVTFDSVIVEMLNVTDIPKFIKENRDMLTGVDEDTATIDDFFAYDDEPDYEEVVELYKKNVKE
jgi:hypothetical protein